MKIYRTICFILIFLLTVCLIPSGIFAGETTPQENLIQEIKPFSDAEAHQTVVAGCENTLNLPLTLSVRFQGQTDFVKIPVTWNFDSKAVCAKPGSFEYIPEISHEYQLQVGLSLPAIHLDIIKASTSVSGLAKNFKKKSRSTLSDEITVTSPCGRTLKIQLKTNGRWITKKTYQLNTLKQQTLKITYPTDWWKITSSSWRIIIAEGETAEAYTSPMITIKTIRYYQNPSDCIQIKDTITLRHSGAYNLNTGYMGLKVRQVNRYFHIGNKYWPRYTIQTKSRVRTFQRKKKLKVTGVVDKTTWLKMGYSKKSWYTLGAYVSPIRVNPSSTKKEHIEAMISTAKEYLGSDYVVGASGKPSQGADCSGLVMQALYAAGVDPYPVSCVRHSKPGYEYESRNLWKNKKFKSIPYTKKKRGDLIFYSGRGGAIIHIAIYLGNGKVIESWPNKVVIWPIKNSHRSRIAGVKRVFN